MMVQAQLLVRSFFRNDGLSLVVVVVAVVWSLGYSYCWQDWRAEARAHGDR
jgi:alkylhydroperoxidase family enzyme